MVILRGDESGKSGSVNVFFVCGAPKSGTTWLQRILDAHPEVSCSGEGHFFERFSTPAAQVVSNYNRRLRIEAKRVYEGKPYYAPVSQAEFDALVRSFILGRLMTRADASTRWLGDKTPSYVLQLEPLHRVFPEAKVIHILRDPRDVVVSHLGHVRRLGREGIFQPESETHRLSVRVAIDNWLGAVKGVSAFAEAHPALVHEVRYRDLHTDPVGESAKLFGFLGAPADDVLMRQIAASTSFEALSGRPPGQEDPQSFLRKGIPDDWKTSLDPDSVQLIEESCGELMRQKRFVA